MGVIPIRVIIKARRLTFLHYLTKQDENEMLSKVFITQWSHPTNGDWTIQVKEDLKDFNIKMDLGEIAKKSSYSFKKLVKIRSKEYALKYLLKIKSKHSKMENLDYKELKLQNYLNTKEITVQEAKNLFKFRTRGAKFGENMKNNPNVSIACPLCQVQPDTQEHSVQQCSVVREKVNVKGSYKDIFLDDVPVEIVRTLMEIVELREKQENLSLLEALVHP